MVSWMGYVDFLTDPHYPIPRAIETHRDSGLFWTRVPLDRRQRVDGFGLLFRGEGPCDGSKSSAVRIPTAPITANAVPEIFAGTDGAARRAGFARCTAARAKPTSRSGKAPRCGDGRRACGTRLDVVRMAHVPGKGPVRYPQTGGKPETRRKFESRNSMRLRGAAFRYEARDARQRPDAGADAFTPWSFGRRPSLWGGFPSSFEVRHSCLGTLPGK